MITIYTDGACSGNPGVGGWGVVIIENNKKETFLNGGDNDTTNLTRMKMMELLTKGTVPTKTVHSFMKWELTTTHGAHIRTWVIVYDDKSHVQLTNTDLYTCDKW